MHQAVGKLAVVGEQQQSGAVVIETAHGKEPAAAHRFDDIAETEALLRIAHRRHATDRLVVEPVFEALSLGDEAPADLDVIASRNRARAQLRNQSAVDGHFARFDEAFGIASRGNARARQQQLQANAFGRRPADRPGPGRLRA